MPQLDMPLEQLRQYRYPRHAPADLREFWDRTLAESTSCWWPPTQQLAVTGVRAFDITDISFAGFAGEPIRAWSIRQAGIDRKLPAVIEFLGYGSGRSLPHERLLWAAHGFHSLIVDSRGQGSIWNGGDTPDPHGSGPAAPGYLTRGLCAPDQLYYRRLLTDAVLAVKAVRALPGVDGDHVITYGHSQGGGLALGAAALADNVFACLARAPFLCGIDRSIDLATEGPYRELATYLAVHRDPAVLDTLAYVDLALLTPQISCPTWVSVGLGDMVCPPSGIFGAINNLSQPAEVSIWPYNGHEVGGAVEEAQLCRWLADLLA